MRRLILGLLVASIVATATALGIASLVHPAAACGGYAAGNVGCFM